MYRESIAVVDFDQDVEGRRLTALEGCLAPSSTTRFCVSECDRPNTAKKIRERRVAQQVGQGVAVCGRDELHAALGDRSRGQGFGLRPDFIDDDDLGHVVLDRFDHHRVLLRRRRDLHSPGSPDPGMRDIPVASDFVGGVDDDDSLAHLVREHSRRFAEQSGLANAGRPHQQGTVTGLDEIADDVDGSKDGAPDSEREPDHVTLTVPDRRDAVQRTLDSGPIVARERAEKCGRMREVFTCDRLIAEPDRVSRKARLGRSPEVEDDLDQTLEVGMARKRRSHTGR